MSLIITILLLFIFNALFLITTYKYYYASTIYSISIINSLCYSFLPYNYYHITNGLCNINCSYRRKRNFPLNAPLKCKKAEAVRNYKNITGNYKIYVFNTSTYGKLIKKYRIIYKAMKVLLFV